MTPDGVFKPTTKVTLDDGTEIDFKQSGQPLYVELYSR